MEWNCVEDMSVVRETDGNMGLYPEGAQAGTYRMTVDWQENGYTLCTIQVVFFVQYEYASQGGIGR